MSSRILAFILLAGLAGAGSGTAAAEEKPMVAVSILPQADLVERLAGDLVAVEVMLPPGATPHTFEPTLQQMRAVSRARLYFKVGHSHFLFERVWLNRLLEQNRRMTVVNCAEGLALKPDDPHLWLSPPIVREMAIRTAGGLQALLPEHRQRIEARLGKLLVEIDDLDREIREILKPHKGRAFLVFHPAWGYFADAYGLTQIAIEEEGKEPSAAMLARRIDEAKERGIQTVFTQTQTSQIAAREVADALGGNVVPIDPLARDWAANLRRAARALEKSFHR